jgi:transcriptional activator SPT8
MLVDEWDVGSGKQVRSLKMPMESGPVSALCFFPSQSKLIWYYNYRHFICSGSLDNLRLWDLMPSTESSGSLPFRIIPGHHGGIISSIWANPSEDFLVTTSGTRGLVDYPETKGTLFYSIKK